MEEKKNHNKGLRAFLIIAAIVAVIGVTYAFITIVVQGTKTNTITGGSLQLTLNDTDEALGNGEGDTISIDDAFPVTDAVGKESKAYTFKLASTGTKDATYTVYLDPDDYVPAGDTRMLDSQVKAYLTDNAGNVLKDATLVSNLGEKAGATESTLKSRELYSGILKAGTDITFQLRLWIDEGADETVMGKQYATKISVDAVQVPEYAVTVAYPTTETVPPTEEGGTATTKDVIKMESVAVFQGGTATLKVPVKADAGTPSITCTGVQATMETVTEGETQMLQITAPSVSEHTQCTIEYTTGA